jgi:hypothetical protein
MVDMIFLAVALMTYQSRGSFPIVSQKILVLSYIVMKYLKIRIAMQVTVVSVASSSPW